MNEVVKQAAVRLCRAFMSRIKEDGYEAVESGGADFSGEIRPNSPYPYLYRPVILIAVNDGGEITFLKMPLPEVPAVRKAAPLTYNQRTGLFEGQEGGDALEVMATVFRDLKPKEG